MLDLLGRWVGCATLLSAAACGDIGIDEPRSPLDTAGSDADETGDGADADEPEDTGAGEGEDTDPAPPRNPCGDIDCGPGICDEATLVCVCPEGYASLGFECIACEPMADVAIDLPLIVATGTIRINGAVPPGHLYEYGDLLLRNPGTGDEVLLGSTYDGEYHATVLPGTYDLVFARRNGGNLVPMNASGLIDRIVIDNHGPIDIDIETTTVAGAISFGGATPPGHLYENGTIFLRNALTGDEVPLAETHEHEFSVNVLPGSYSVHYGIVSGTNIAPKNPDARLGWVEIPHLTEIIFQLDVDVPVAEIQGTITVGGATPPGHLYENGRIFFVDRSSGTEIDVAETQEGSYAVMLTHGDYDVYYARIAGSTLVPLNSRARLIDRLSIETAQTIDIDVPLVELTGTISVDGQPPPTSTSDDGVLRLHDSETGDSVVLGHTRDGTFSSLVVPGVYEIRYAQATATAVMPANLDAVIGQIEVHDDGDTDVVVEIPTVDVRGEITVAGAAPPTSEYSDGRLYLRDLDSGDSVLLGNTRLGAFERRVVPGRYEIVYAVETTGDGVPLNGAAHLGTVDVTQTPEFDVDVPLVRSNGAITVAGASPPSDDANHGILFLQDLRSADRLSVGDTRTGTYSTRITAGQYAIGYRVSQSEGLVPQNADTLFACIDLLAE
jgi:hypothetical protein